VHLERFEGSIRKNAAERRNVDIFQILIFGRDYTFCMYFKFENEVEVSRNYGVHNLRLSAK